MFVSSAALAMLLHLNVLTFANGGTIPKRQLTPKSKRERAFDAIDFLTRYGYLSHDIERPVSEADIISAVSTFQEFSGLSVTGALDTKTVQKMKTPRCGNTDTAEFYEFPGSKWNKTILSWKTTKNSSKLPLVQQWIGLIHAVVLWTTVTPILYFYGKPNSEIIFRYEKGNHGDGVINSFDGPGGIIAHAFKPGEGMGGAIHFDDDEHWSVETHGGLDLTTTAAHEVGHALGLSHSSEPEALMFPYYKAPIFGKPKLHTDDILKIQKVYGKKIPRGKWHTLEMKLPDFCQTTFRLDAFAQGGDGFTYAFRLGKVYKIGPNGLEAGYPKKIAAVFPGGPRRFVAAATFVPANNKFYMFNQGMRVWRYSQVSAQFQLDEGYPKLIPGDKHYKPTAALTQRSKGTSQLTLFSGDTSREWNIHHDRIASADLFSNTDLRGASGIPDAAFQNSRGSKIFFTSNTYRVVKDLQIESESKPFGPDLFGAACGGTPIIFQLGDY